MLRGVLACPSSAPALTSSVRPAQVTLERRCGFSNSLAAAELCELTHARPITRNGGVPTALGRSAPDLQSDFAFIASR
jgi:hypothetical protein